MSVCRSLRADRGVPKTKPIRRPTWQSERLSLIRTLRGKGLSWREIGARIDLDPKYARTWFAAQMAAAPEKSNDNRPPIGLAGTPAMRAQRILRGRGYIVVRLTAERYSVDGHEVSRAALVASAGVEETRTEFPEIPYFTTETAARYLIDFADWDILINSWSSVSGRDQVEANGRAMTAAAVVRAAQDHYYAVTGWRVPSRCPPSHNLWGRGVRP